MKHALQCYEMALDQAKEMEKNGSLVSEHAGGSAHGSCEVLYRLHASRLKCLIAAVDRVEKDRDLAELEGLRLSERHWFIRPEGLEESSDTRDRVWKVLGDVVAALAYCRSKQPFFHRSVYRHAQALMWAPVLCDPAVGRVDGSLSTVPLSRAVHIRGLNVGNTASSALIFMQSLFDKKR